MKRMLIILGLFFPIARSGGAQELASMDRDGVQRVRLVAGDYFFRPNRIVLKANVPAEITVSAEPGSVPRDIVVSAPQAGMTIDAPLPDAPRTIRFTSTAPGTYAYYCSNRLPFFNSHRERSIEGVIELRQSL